MQSDTSAFVYDFDKSYYENYYTNRYQAFATSGDFYNMFHDNWSKYDSVKEIDGVLVNNGIDVAWYIHKHFDGDMPECMTQVLLASIMAVLAGALAVALAASLIVVIIVVIVAAFIGWLLGGSFICTATSSIMEGKCAREFLDKLKKYRDITMTDKESRDMLRYYKVLGPKIVAEIDKEDDSEVVYKYIYAEYLIKLERLIDSKKDAEVLILYFKLVDDMVTRYNIKTNKRYKTWQSRLLKQPEQPTQP